MIVAKNGRYGPYVSHNGVNANLPNDKTPETITLDEAAALIDARAERGGGSSARRKRPPRRVGAGEKGGRRQRPAAKPKKRAAASAAKAPRKTKKIEAANKHRPGVGASAIGALRRMRKFCRDWQARRAILTFQPSHRAFRRRDIHWLNNLIPSNPPSPARKKSSPSSARSPARSARARSPAPSI